MRFNYLVYPEAKERLQSLCLEERFNEAEKTEEGLPFFGTHVMKEEVVDCVNDMKERGYFKTLPKEEGQQFTTQLNQVFQNLDKHLWRVERKGEIIKEKADLHDLLLMTGWISSLLLKPEENWDYKKFGFESLSSFTGSVGALVWQLRHGTPLRKRYKWKSTSPDGRNYLGSITGDTHGCLMIYKNDITPDKTFDPLGNEVLYRPELDDDRRVIHANDSVELPLLVSLLKYADQQEAPSEMLKKGALPLMYYIAANSRIEDLERSPSFISLGDNPEFLFSHFDVPIPALDENFSTRKHSFDGIASEGEGSFGIYVGSDKELVFSYENPKNTNPVKTPSAVFYPEEIDHLLKGVSFQCAKRLGRVSPRSLIDLLNYRFSNQFEKK